MDAREQSQNGRLARAVWPDERADFAGHKLERHLVRGDHGAEALRQPLCDEQRTFRRQGNARHGRRHRRCLPNVCRRSAGEQRPQRRNDPLAAEREDGEQQQRREHRVEARRLHSFGDTEQPGRSRDRGEPRDARRRAE